MQWWIKIKRKRKNTMSKKRYISNWLGFQSSALYAYYYVRSSYNTCMYTAIQLFMLVQEKEDTKNQQPMEYAVVDKSKKKKKKDDKQEKV